MTSVPGRDPRGFLHPSTRSLPCHVRRLQQGRARTHAVATRALPEDGSQQRKPGRPPAPRLRGFCPTRPTAAKQSLPAHPQVITEHPRRAADQCAGQGVATRHICDHRTAGRPGKAAFRVGIQTTRKSQGACDQTDQFHIPHRILQLDGANPACPPRRMHLRHRPPPEDSAALFPVSGAGSAAFRARPIPHDGRWSGPEPLLCPIPAAPRARPPPPPAPPAPRRPSRSPWPSSPRDAFRARRGRPPLPPPC